MANLTPTPGWDDVPQLETTTPALAGPGGAMNSQAQALVNRLESLCTGQTAVDVVDAGGWFPGLVSKTVEIIIGLFGRHFWRNKVQAYSHLVVGGDWSPAWQAAHDYVEGLANGGVVEFLPEFSGKFKTQIVWNPNKVGVKCNGAVLDCSDFSGASYFVKLRQTIMDANLRSAANRAHPWTDFIILGTGSATGAIAGFDISDHDLISGGPWAAGVTFRDGAMINWWRDFVIGDGGFFLRLDNISFAITGGSGYDTSLLVQVSSNSGENISLNGCFFGKVYGTNIRCLSPNTSIIAKGCSADYTACLFDIQGGSLDWDGYIENNADSDYWIKVTGTNTLVRIAGELYTTGSKSSKEIAYVDASCTNGGLDLDVNLQFSGGVSYPLKVVSGTGRVQARLRGHSRTTVHPAIGGGANLLANGGFESAALTDWVLTGAVTPPSRTAGPARTGTYSLRFAGSTTNTPVASLTTPCSAGQQFCGEFWWQSAGLAGSGGTFYVLLEYLDRGGSVLASAAVLSTQVSVGVWTLQQVYTFEPAPVGAVNARLTMQLFGTTSGAPSAYIDDATFAVV